MELEGRTAIVTGSAKRIGRALAMELSRAGANVIVNARSSQAEADDAVADIRRQGGKAVACLADITRPDDVARLIRTAVDAFGGLDILVNNAAIRPHDHFADLDIDKWRAVTSVILDGSFLCAHAAAPHLIASGNGRIINIGGTSAHRGAKDRLPVMTAKSALVGLTKGLALELAPHVTANCVVPALIEDEADSKEVFEARRQRMSPDIVPLQRTGRPRDVASTVKFLCSEGGSYITGQTIHVNGGVYLW